MRLVHLTTSGTLEIAFMWLPTWMGLSSTTTEAIERELKAKVLGTPATEENLDIINEMVLDLLAARYSSIEGLRDYLDGLKFIRI